MPILGAITRSKPHYVYSANGNAMRPDGVLWCVGRDHKGPPLELAEADELHVERKWEDANAGQRLLGAGTPLRWLCLPTELRT